MIKLSILSLICHCLSAFLIFHFAGSRSASNRYIQLSPALAATLLQAYLLAQLIYPGNEQLNLGFFNAMSLIGWLVCIQILISSLYRPLQSLGIIMFPLCGIAFVLATYLPSNQAFTVSSQFISSHIMISVIAYSLIMLSAIQALALAFQDHAIRSHHPGGFIRFLPPLHDMETLLFQMLGFGFIFLTTALLSGVFFVEDLFAQQLVHKTVLSIIGWVILATLLYGRYKFGWRGKMAIRWTITSFVFIMLAYFGSKLVLEFIVQNNTNL